MKSSHAMLGAFAVLVACGRPPDPSVEGTVVGTWTYSGKATRPATTSPHTDTFTTAGGMGLEVQWSSGTVTLPDGAKRQVPLDIDVVVKSNPNGWHAPSTSAAPSFLVNEPSNMQGDASDVASCDVNLFVNRGHRHLGGTSFDNERIMVRLHGDGHAKQLKEVPSGPNASTWTE